MKHVIDCGGNVGQSILYFLNEYDGPIKIDSFEPYDKNYNIIEKMYGNNPLITIHHNAIWIEDEKKKFYTQSWGARTGSSLCEGKRSTTKDEYIEVEAIDLAKWLKENLDPENENILKIDIEGAEYPVIDHLLDNGIGKLISQWLIEWTPVAKIPTYTKEYTDRVKNRFLRCNYNYVNWDFHV